MPEVTTLPNHVGIIIDGNRRWARENNLPTTEGHRIGAEMFKEISLHAFDKGISYVSAYVFSTENWKRTEEEIGYLMQMVAKAVEKYLEEFHERGIRVVILGRREGLRNKVLNSITRSEEKTKNNTNGTLALCLNYGGREEIADAANKLINSSSEITTNTLRNAMYHSEIPDVDMIIRTSGEQRLSNFMLWRAAYAELVFVKKHWPAFTTNDFDQAVTEFSKRQRRFGN